MKFVRNCPRIIGIILILACSPMYATEIDLSQYEVSIYSEHGEDGVLSKILSLIPNTSRFCVELGAYDGITGSHTYLLRRQGWQCILLDRLFEAPAHHLYQEFIRAENISELFLKYQVPQNLDVLSIDIGYNNFYIWEKLDPKYQAKIVIIECNPMHLPKEDKVVRYRPFYCGDETNYYGASILALYNLGKAKGYSLVYFESSGTNLFFIKDSILEEQQLRFKNVNDVEKLYRNASNDPGSKGGYRVDLKNREYVSSVDLLL